MLRIHESTRRPSFDSSFHPARATRETTAPTGACALALRIRKLRRSIPRVPLAAAVVALALLGAGGRAEAADLFVAVTGVDNLDCGPEGTTPCRSISRAIAHAADDDRIVVGPGLYGDINRDGAVDGSGDSGEETLTTLDVGTAVVAITKRVSVVSRDGAISTLIETGSASYGAVVAITADGAEFGKRGKGFTLRQGVHGLSVHPSVTGAKVAGNIAESCQYGFYVGSNVGVVASQATELSGNAARSCDIGFVVIDKTALVRGNLAVGNWTGFNAQGSAGTLVTKNLAAGNTGAGFILSMTPPYTDAAMPTFTGNAALGNGGPGLLVATYDVLAPVSVDLARNSLAGNSQDEMYGDNNCGLLVTNYATVGVTVNADENWWGASSGPGPDPADTAGGVCIFSSFGAPVAVNVTEWSAKELKVNPKIK